MMIPNNFVTNCVKFPSDERNEQKHSQYSEGILLKFSATAWVNFLKTCPNQQILLSFGSPEIQQTKCLEHPQTHDLYSWLKHYWLDYSHCLDCGLSSRLKWLCYALSSVTCHPRYAPGSWTRLFKISIESSVFVCSYSGHNSFGTSEQKICLTFNFSIGIIISRTNWNTYTLGSCSCYLLIFL